MILSNVYDPLGVRIIMNGNLLCETNFSRRKVKRCYLVLPLEDEFNGFSFKTVSVGGSMRVIGS